MPTMPNNRYSESALRTISTLYSLSSVSANSANVFECCRCISFLLAASVCLPVTIQTYWKLRCVFFSSFPLSFCMRKRDVLHFFPL